MSKIDFRHPYWGNCASVGPGWLHILLELDQKMREIAPELRWRGIEEKFGELRARPDIKTIPSGVLDQARELVHAARRKSAATCEECGKPGMLRKEHGPLRTRCDQCDRMED